MALKRFSHKKKKLLFRSRWAPKFPSKQTKIKRRAAGRHRSPGDVRKRGQHAPPLPGLPPAHTHPIPRVSHAAPSIGRAHASILASYQYHPTLLACMLLLLYRSITPTPASMLSIDCYISHRARARPDAARIPSFISMPGRSAGLPVEKLQLAQYRYHIQVQPCSSLQLGSETYVDR